MLEIEPEEYSRNEPASHPIGDPQIIEPILEYLEPLGLKASDIKEWHFCNPTRFLMLVLNSEDKIASITPDYNQLIKVQQPEDLESIIVTAESQKYDFVSRFFGPWIGINEDPVTGAAHTTLGKYWSEKLLKDVLHGKQISKRSGDVIVKVGKERVKLIGSAKTMLKGEFLL